MSLENNCVTKIAQIVHVDLALLAQALSEKRCKSYDAEMALVRLNRLDANIRRYVPSETVGFTVPEITIGDYSLSASRPYVHVTLSGDAANAHAYDVFTRLVHLICDEEDLQFRESAGQ